MPPKLTAAQANKLFYRDVASEYDQTERCLVDPLAQSKLRDALARALDLAPEQPRVLDACGGSGNVGAALARYNVVPVVVDVSPEMVALWRQKAADLGVDDPEIHLEPVEEFFARDPRKWDLITFSSALHHLEDPGAVLEAAVGRLAPGGVLMTLFDPTLAGRGGRLLRTLDWVLEELVENPRRTTSNAIRVLRRRGSAEDNPEEFIGRLAERYATAGIDDAALVGRLRALGLDVLVHERYVDARLRLVRGAFKVLQRPSAFHVIARKPAH